MTADVELLPLYAELQGHPKLEIVKHYARANVAHATAAKDAEIEALRAEREVIGAEAVKYAEKSGRLEARAERLAEALRELVEYVQETAHHNAPAAAAARAALRDHDQEVGNP